jgi:hypothetical protein
MADMKLKVYTTLKEQGNDQYLAWWLMPVIPATQKVEIVRIVV